MRDPLDILVVDDEAPIAAAIAAVLRRRGHVVQTAFDAEAAMQLDAPDVLISELALPRVSGLDLLAHLHERGIRPHTVFVTARPAVEDCRRALLMGASEYLVKPFRLEELVRAAEAGPARSTAPEHDSLRDGFDRFYAASATCAENIAREVAAFALAHGIGPSCRARIASACSEIVDNARRHGYAHGRGRVRVSANIEERALELLIQDEGRGFDAALVVSGHLDSTLRSGLARAMALSEDMIVVTAPGKGTEVTLRFSITRADLGDALTIDLTERDWLSPDVARNVLHALQRRDTADLFQLSPSLAVVVGRLLAGPDPRRALEPSLGA
jgi:DNA-binding response OmpR family regulator